MLGKLSAFIMGGVLALSAATVTYTDEATFLAALGSHTTHDFDGFAAGTAITNQLAGISSVSTDGDNGSTQAGIGSISSLTFTMSPSTHSGDNFLSSELTSPIFATAGLTFQLSAPSMGVGFWITDGAPLGGPIIRLFSSGALVGTATFGSRKVPDSFAGVTSDVAFDSFHVDSSSDTDSWGLDNLTIGTSAVPEPSTFLLAAAAFSLLAVRRRSRSAESKSPGAQNSQHS